MLNGASLLKEGNVITTKELCAVLGVAPSTIRLYEKYLPKDPWARGQNNYRGFHFENMLCLLTARLLGSYGISMKESVEVILAGDLTSMDCELGQRVSPLAEERRRASDLIESLDRDRALLAKVPYLLEAYEVIDIPSFFYLESAWTKASSEQQRLVRTWSREIPFVHYTPHYHVEGLGDGAEPSPDLPRSGFSVPTRFTDYVDLASPHVRFVPSFKAVALVIRVDGIFSESSERDKGTMPFNEPLCVRALDMVSSALSREGSELTGNIYTQLLFANLPLRADGSDAVQYYYVFSPLVR